MQPDERIVNYMKERNGYAKTVACVIAVQLFALAAYFLMYSLVVGDVFYSLSTDSARVVIMVIAAVIAVFLCVVNCMTVIKRNKVYITRPDSVSIRDTHDAVRLAYDTARPVLILKITYSLVLLTVSGIVYITLMILIQDQFFAGLYGRIVCCIFAAVAVLIAYPCIDRISCYRALLGETHELYVDRGNNRVSAYIAALALPLSLCLWYVLRFFGTRGDIAWIVFPVTLLFGLAIAFLAAWTGREKGGENC